MKKRADLTLHVFNSHLCRWNPHEIGLSAFQQTDKLDRFIIDPSVRIQLLYFCWLCKTEITSLPLSLSFLELCRRFFLRWRNSRKRSILLTLLIVQYYRGSVLTEFPMARAIIERGTHTLAHWRGEGTKDESEERARAARRGMIQRNKNSTTCQILSILKWTYQPKWIN